MSRLGPTRLILINSGPYAYADVDLTRSGHLVGENNVGKTSLIAVLQFLYMADQDDMRFSERRDISRQFYFRSDKSFIVFELETVEGTRCMLVQGLGPARMHQFERWIYNGPYRKEHYISGNRIRPPEHILAELGAACGAVKVSPGELRQALTGFGRKNVPNLGIVPVKEERNYPRFVSVFRNLIHLDQVRQQELKQLLIEISPVKSTAINLAEKYGSLFEHLRRDTTALDAFESMLPDIEEALSAAAERERLRSRIMPLWDDYKRLYDARLAALREETAELERRIKEACAADDDITTALQALAQAQMEASERRGTLTARLDALEQLESEFDGFDEQFERTALANESSRLREIQGRLYQAEQAVSAAALEQRLQQRIAERDALRQRLDNVSRQLAARLRQHFSETQLRQAFALLNPGLLAEPIDGERIALVDEAALHQRLDALLARIEGQVYQDEAIRLDLSRLPAPNLSDYLDPAAIERRIESLEQEIREYAATLETARNQAALQAEAGALERRVQQTQLRLARYQELKQLREQAPQWRDQLLQLEQDVRQLDGQRQQLEAERERITRSVQEARQALEQREQERRALHRAHQEIFDRLNQLPDRFQWPSEPLAPSGERSVKEAWEALRHALERHAELDAKLEHALSRIRRHPQHTRFMGDGSQEEQLDRLRERLEAFADQKTMLKQRWAGLLTGLSQEASLLLDSLAQIDEQCQRLTHQIGRMTISNLAGLTVRATRNREVIQQLEALRVQGIRQGELGLDPAMDIDIAAALERVDNALRQRHVIRLEDAFELSFDVTLPGGQTRSYAQLNQIQSNGTTVTIKVLVNMLLMRGLLAEQPERRVSIPFYLDEVARLSINNVQAIVQMAKDQGCVPILASPTDLEAADVLYLLRPNAQGRLYLTEAHRVELRRREAAEPAA